MASVKDLLLRVGGEDAGGGRLLQQMGAELEAFDGIESDATLSIDDLDAHRAIDRLRADLDEYDAASFDATAGVDTSMAHADLDFLEHRLDAYGRERYDAKVGVDGVAEALAEIALLKRELASLQRRGGGGIFGGGGTGGITGGPGGILGGAGGLSGRGVQYAIGAGAAIAPTIGTSLVQGVLGAGAVGAAAGGAGLVGGGGILSVAIGGITGLGKALQGYAQDEQNASTAAVQRASAQLSASTSAQQANEQVTTSATALARAQVAGDQAVQGAEESLGNAQRSERYAQEALNEARRQAVRDLADMRRSAEESVTAEQQARLNLEQAQRSLAQGYRQGIRGVDLEQLRLNVTEAKQALEDAGTARERAQEDAARAERRGIHGDPGVEGARRARDAARRQVIDAERQLVRTQVAAAQQVSDAERQLADAIRARGVQAQQAALQQKALNLSTNAYGKALGLLDPAGRKVAGMIENLRSRWKASTADARDNFFGLIGDSVQFATDRLPLFSASATSSMTAARAAVDQFLGRLDSPIFDHFVNVMTVTFAQALPPLTHGLADIGEILARIAIAAAPELIHMLNRFADDADVWLKHARNSERLRRHIHEYVGQFRAWLGLIGAVGHLLAALFLNNQRDAHDGKRAVQDLTDTFDRWAHWLNTHRGSVHRFFGGILDSLTTILDTVATMAASFGPVLQVAADAFKPISNAIHTIVEALNSLKIGNISALTVLLGAMAGKRILTSIPGLLGTGEAAAGGAAGAGLLARGWNALKLGGIGTGLADAAGGSVAAGGALLGGGAAALAVGGYGALTSPGSLNSLHLGGPGGIVPMTGTDPLSGEFVQKIIDQYGSLGKAARSLKGDAKDTFLAMARDANDSGQLTDSALSHITTAFDRAADHAHATAQEVRGSKLGHAFADAIASGDGDIKHVLDKVRDRFLDVPPTVRDAYVKSAHQQLDRLHEMGLITHAQESKALEGLEDLQRDSLRRQGRRLERFGEGVGTLFHQAFGSLVNIADNALGKKGVAGIVNQLLVGVDSSKKLHWNATTAGTALANVAGISSAILSNLGAGARGARIDKPMFLVGEEAPQHDEYVIATNPAYRQRNVGLLAEAAGRLGIPGFAQGGVPTASGQFAGMHPAIISLISFMLQRFGGSMGSGYRTPAQDIAAGGSGTGDHTRGLAGDWSGGDWAGGTAFANRIGAQLLQGIHQGPPGSNVSWSGGSQVPPSYWGPSTWADHVDHIHLSTANVIKATGLAGVPAALGAAIQSIPRLLLHGPDGSLKDAGQGALDLGRKEANRYLAHIAAQAAAAATGPGAVPIPAHLARGAGSIPAILASVARKTKASPLAALAMYEAAIVESGDPTLSTNPGYGDRSSLGVFQLLASTAAGLGVDPMNVAATAYLFLKRGFYTGSGAITDAAEHPDWSAGAIAQAEEGSAYPGRYDVVKAIALQFMRQQGLGVRGLATGTSSASAGWHLLGENGPELANLPGGTRVVAAEATARMLAALDALGGRPALGAAADGGSKLRVVIEDHRTVVYEDDERVRDIARSEVADFAAFQGRRDRVAS